MPLAAIANARYALGRRRGRDGHIGVGSERGV